MGTAISKMVFVDGPTVLEITRIGRDDKDQLILATLGPSMTTHMAILVVGRVYP